MRDPISLDDLTSNNLGTFKKINTSSLPVKYPESWYKDSLNKDQIISLGYYRELPVAGIKLKTISTQHNINCFETGIQQQLNSKILPNAVYIESFAVLKPYRHLGIGSKLLDFAIEKTKQHFVHEITAHVHVDNHEALDWYLKHGFQKDENVLKDYFKQQGLPNPDAYIIRMKV
ncbi:uncharacterized protein KQ657_005054 [Scheffersomyces spartinae]|uniref:N-acetyltransferase domain-containing protein n=1 Tax=Scheffersomyces spartinae TaxID=45513 RepID=A0A9P7V9G4_9ASCO|nr:uncharacterized protein KQ657_005054 [Scheffersomyces spartinae]KAG7193856.1 hypothetical protein KQ657_005054 [Scheffersomyces spartinae]